MAFKPIGSLSDREGPILYKVVLSNSITAVVHDSVRLLNGFVALGTTGQRVFGHIVSIVNKNGVSILKDGGMVNNEITTSATNQTSEMHSAVCDISKFTLYSATLDAPIGTTTGSNLAGYHTNIADEDDIKENSATTSSAQYTIWGVDPNNSSNGVYSIYESQVLGV